MFIKNWKNEVFTIPNLLSLFRLVLIPVYIGIYRNATEFRHYFTAGVILAISCITDALDGRIARRYNMISTVGKVLDPLADKLTQISLMLCLSYRHTVLQPVLILLLIKELVQVGLAILYLRQGQMLSGALMAGKVCTAVLFVSMILLVIHPNLPANIVKYIAITDELMLLISFSGYIGTYWNMRHSAGGCDAK